MASNFVNKYDDIIDFVVTWVDGNDIKWIEEKNKYIENGGDTSVARYRDWDLLKYWFEGVEKYAPWVRYIHFVTWGHVPEFLSQSSNKKVRIVNHSDFIPEKYLPTFNSHTIELNLHRINDLAEKFVYFNDDVFLIDKISPSYFFKNNVPCLTFGLTLIKFKTGSIGHILASDISVINDNFQVRKVISKNWRKVFSLKNGLKNVIRTFALFRLYGYFTGLYDRHSAIPMLKSTYEEVWSKEYELLDKTCLCKFRNEMNINPYLFEYWQLVTGDFSPSNSKWAKTVQIHSLKSVIGLDEKFKNKKVICINDTDKIDDSEFEKIKDAVKEYFHHKMA